MLKNEGVAQEWLSDSSAVKRIFGYKQLLHLKPITRLHSSHKRAVKQQNKSESKLASVRMITTPLVSIKCKLQRVSGAEIKEFSR